MAIKLGTSDISKVYLGATEVSKIYLGATEIYRSFFLDTYTNAAAAYSLQKLKSTTTNVIRARRSSDNAELNFTAEEITDGTLTTWTGAGDGFVQTIYDQSGEGNNATQTTANSQPKIVSSGSLVLENGEPAINFDGSNDHFIVWNDTTAPTVFQNMSDAITVLAVETPTVITGDGANWYTANTILEIRNNTASYKAPLSVGYSHSWFGFGVTDSLTSNAELHFSSTVTAIQRLSTSIVNGDVLDVRLNSVAEIDETFSVAAGDRSVGNRNSSFTIGVRTRNGGQPDNAFYTGNVQEIILYKANKTSDIVAMEANTDTRYGL
tara:strand:- start:449 stop:1414 length:966 start_codon:yes stop_codon:yes gene_type:complete